MNIDVMFTISLLKKANNLWKQLKALPHIEDVTRLRWFSLSISCLENEKNPAIAESWPISDSAVEVLSWECNRDCLNAMSNLKKKRFGNKNQIQNEL